MIHKSEEGNKLANPGTVRISISDAVECGISDPRNGIMLKIFSLIEFGERAGSRLSGICKRWENVYHTPVTIEETHKDGVDRTILTLSTGGHEQDIKAMLELYSDLLDPTAHQPDQETTQTNPKSDQKSRLKIITITQLATDLSMSPSGIKKILKTLKDSGRIQRVGPDKGGHWEIISNE